MQVFSWHTTYCEIILIRGAFNYAEFVGKTIHKINLSTNNIKFPQVDFRMLDLLVNHINIWYEPRILLVCSALIKQWFNSSDSH